MEQYQLVKKLDFENLRFCLDNYIVDDIFIRLKGSSGGTVKVNENLEEGILDFRKDKSGIHFIIDKNEIFSLPLKDYARDGYQKGLTLAYERFELYEYKGKSYERQMTFGLGDYTYGIDPYDKRFPEPKSSVFRTVWDSHLVEIAFKGRIDIKFHSWWNEKSGWKYWNIVK